MAQRFRLPVIIIAAISIFLSGASIFFIFSAFNQRSDDFTLVSAGPVTSSCVSYVTDTQLQMANYHKTDWSCGDNSKKDLANLLSASVHAAYAVNSVAAFTGDAERTYLTLISLAHGGAGHELSHEQAYAMLSLLAVTAPTSLTCEAIYPGATLQTTDPNQIDPTIKCVADGTPADATSDLTAVSDVDANAAAVDSNATAVDANATAGDADVTTVDANGLYTHCVHQHTYGFSYPTSGTFAIPKQGIEPKPVILNLFEVNSTTSSFKRAQVLVGTRWGYSTIAYIFFMLSSAFLLMDCMVLLLAELTRVDAYFSQNALTQGSGKTMKEGMMTMLATFVAKRNFRFTIALILILIEIVVWVLLVGLPWGFGISFGRPICEATKSYWLFGPVWAEAAGGFKSDWGPSLLEYITMFVHIFVLVAIPISTLLGRRGGGRTGQREREGAGGTDGWTGVAVKSLRSSWWFTALSVGALIIYVGQAVADFRFGIAWAAAITKNEFSPPAVAAALYDQINALLFLTLTIGFALASIIGRWLLAGLSCTSFTIFLLWIGLTLGGFVPLFITSGYWLFFTHEGGKGKEDCAAIFGDSDSGNYEFARIACDIRLWTYVVGVCFLLVAVLGPTILGLIDYTKVILLPRRRAWVEMPSYWARLVDPANSKYRSINASMTQPLDSLAVGNGYTGKKGGFFDFSTKLTVSAAEVRSANV